MTPRVTLSTSVCITQNLSDNYDVSSAKYKKITIIKLKFNKAAGGKLWDGKYKLILKYEIKVKFQHCGMKEFYAQYTEKEID
jgi:hypothetical protein